MRKLSSILLKDSQKELKITKTIVVAALLIAIKLTLDALNIRISITPSLRITFSFLTTAVCGILFGPATAFVMAGAGDLIGYFVNTGGGPYFPGFTLTAALSGWVWGMGLYQEKITFVRVLLTRGLINLFLNIGLNGLWLYLLYNKGFFVELPARIIKNIALLPLEAMLVVALAHIVKKAYSYKSRP